MLLNTVATVLLLLGVSFLLISKVRMGNRDGRFMDAVIEVNKPAEEKLKDASSANKLFILGIVFVSLGVLILLVGTI
jgi:hypothetical protein